MDATQETTRRFTLKPALRWTPLVLICLVVFTLLKFPTYQLKAKIQDAVTSALQPLGVSFSSEESSLSLLLGMRYRMKNVSLSFSQSPEVIKLDRLTVRPSFLSIFSKKLGGTIILEKGAQELSVAFAGNQTSFDLNLSFDSVDLVDLGLLQVLSATSPMMGSILQELLATQPKLQLQGNVQVKNSSTSMKTLNGKIDLRIERFLIPKSKINIQNFGTMSLPRLQISEGKISAQILDGKVQINTLEIGKAGSPDDLIGEITGKVDLGQRGMDGSLDLKTKFKLSDAFLKDLGPIGQGLLNSAKQSDGRYAYRISGGLMFPQYTPGP